MNTTEGTSATAVGGSALSEELGPLPEPDGEFYSWRGQYRVQSKAAYSAETVLRLLAAEREKCAVIAETSHPHDWAFIGAAIRNGGPNV